MPDTFESLSSSSIKKITKKTLLDLCKKNKLYQTPHLNDVLYLHYQGFGDIENLDEYTGLKCLWLECNAISEIKGLEKLSKLKCLFLQNNLIKKIENLEPCKELDNINLSNNHITRIENCGSDILPALSSLNLSHNCLRTYDNLKELANCKTLSVCDLANNRIEDILVVKVFSEMPELRVLVLQGNPVVNDIPQYRKTLILECQQLTYLDSRPVFPRDRACAEAWKRGGYDEERREHGRWNKQERKKIRDSVNATLRLRNRGNGEPNVDLIPSSDDDIDDKFERSSAPLKRDSRGSITPAQNIDGAESSSSDGSETESDKLIIFGSRSTSEGESSKSKDATCKTKKPRKVLNLNNLQHIEQDVEDILDTAYIYHNIVEEDYQKLVLDDVDMETHRKDSNECYKTLYNEYVEYVNGVMELNEKMDSITVEEIAQMVNEVSETNNNLSITESTENKTEPFDRGDEAQDVLEENIIKEKHTDILDSECINESEIDNLKNENLVKDNENEIIIQNPSEIYNQTVSQMDSEIHNFENIKPSNISSFNFSREMFEPKLIVINENSQNESVKDNAEKLAENINIANTVNLLETIAHDFVEIDKEADETFLLNIDRNEQVNDIIDDIINDCVDSPKLNEEQNIDYLNMDIAMLPYETSTTNRRSLDENKEPSNIENSMQELAVHNNNLPVDCTENNDLLDQIEKWNINIEDLMSERDVDEQLEKSITIPEVKNDNKNINNSVEDRDSTNVLCEEEIEENQIESIENYKNCDSEHDECSLHYEAEYQNHIKVLTDEVPVKDNSEQSRKLEKEESYYSDDSQYFEIEETVSITNSNANCEALINVENTKICNEINHDINMEHMEQNSSSHVDVNINSTNDQLGIGTPDTNQNSLKNIIFPASELETSNTNNTEEKNQKSDGNCTISENQSALEVFKDKNINVQQRFEFEINRNLKFENMLSAISDQKDICHEILLEINSELETIKRDCKNIVQKLERVDLLANGPQINTDNSEGAGSSEIKVVPISAEISHSKLKVSHTPEECDAKILDLYFQNCTEYRINSVEEIDVEPTSAFAIKTEAERDIVEEPVADTEKPADITVSALVSNVEEIDSNLVTNIAEINSSIENSADIAPTLVSNIKEIASKSTTNVEEIASESVANVEEIASKLVTKIEEMNASIANPADAASVLASDVEQITSIENPAVIASTLVTDKEEIASESATNVEEIASKLVTKIEEMNTATENPTAIVSTLVTDKEQIASESATNVEEIASKLVTKIEEMNTSTENPTAIVSTLVTDKEQIASESATNVEEIASKLVTKIDEINTSIENPVDIASVLVSNIEEIVSESATYVEEIASGSATNIKEVPSQLVTNIEEVDISIENPADAASVLVSNIEDIASKLVKNIEGMNSVLNKDGAIDDKNKITENILKPKSIDLTDDPELLNCISLYLSDEDVQSFTKQYGTTDYKSMLNDPKCLRNIQSILNLEMLKSEKNEKKDTLFFSMQKIQNILRIFRTDYD